MAKWIRRHVLPIDIDKELAEKDNLAVALCSCGYYFSTLFIFVASKRQTLIKSTLIRESPFPYPLFDAS